MYACKASCNTPLGDTHYTTHTLQLATTHLCVPLRLPPSVETSKKKKKTIPHEHVRLLKNCGSYTACHPHPSKKYPSLKNTIASCMFVLPLCPPARKKKKNYLSLWMGPSALQRRDISKRISNKPHVHQNRLSQNIQRRTPCPSSAPPSTKTRS